MIKKQDFYNTDFFEPKINDLVFPEGYKWISKMITFDQDKRFTIEDVLIQLNLIPSDSQVSMEISYDYPDYFETSKISDKEKLFEVEDKEKSKDFDKSLLDNNLWKVVEIQYETFSNYFGKTYEIMKTIYEPINSELSEEDLFILRRLVWKDVIPKGDSAPGPASLSDIEEINQNNEEFNSRKILLVDNVDEEITGKEIYII